MHDTHPLRKAVEVISGVCDEIDDLFIRSKSAVKLLWRYRRNVLAIIRQAEVLTVVMANEHPEDLLDVKTLTPKLYLASRAVTLEIDSWTIAVMDHNVRRAHEAMCSTEPIITILPKEPEK